MSPSTGIGFFWALGGVTMLSVWPTYHILLTSGSAAAGRREMYRFSVDLAKLALDIAELHGGSKEKW
jgi:hypothetical protein